MLTSLKQDMGISLFQSARVVPDTGAAKMRQLGVAEIKRCMVKSPLIPPPVTSPILAVPSALDLRVIVCPVVVRVPEVRVSVPVSTILISFVKLTPLDELLIFNK